MTSYAKMWGLTTVDRVHGGVHGSFCNRTRSRRRSHPFMPFTISGNALNNNNTRNVHDRSRANPSLCLFLSVHAEKDYRDRERERLYEKTCRQVFP